MSTDAIYSEVTPRECRANCQHRGYDSFHDEMYCRHKPPPDNLGPRLLIDPDCWCEFCEKDKWPQSTPGLVPAAAIGPGCFTTSRRTLGTACTSAVTGSSAQSISHLD